MIKKEQIKTLLRECSAVIVLGEKWNKAVKEIEPLTKTIILNNTVCMQKATVRWNQPFRVLSLGVLVKRKGVDDLLKAISLLSSFISADCVQFIIAGSGQEEESLKQYSAKLGINNYIQFLGWIDGDQKKEIMKNSQMLVLPSYNEGLPMSVLEAISYGMPIVSTDVGDVSSVVHDGENGFLIQPGGVEQLKNRLMLLITNKDLYEKMSLKSKIIANASFSDKAYFDTIYTLYKDLIKTGGN